MEYRSGTLNRVFIVRFDHKDDFLSELTALIKKENIRNGWLHVIGGLQEAGVVTGPQKAVMPPEPVWEDLHDARETLGSGTFFWDDEEPKIHLHAALGHHGDTMTACVRKGTKVYLILEVIIFEIDGIDATRPWYPEGGFSRLTFSE